MILNIWKKSKERKIGETIHQLHTIAGIIVGIKPDIGAASLLRALQHYVFMVQIPRITSEEMLESIVCTHLNSSGIPSS